MSEDENAGRPAAVEAETYDYDALVARLKRNAIVSLIAVAILGKPGYEAMKRCSEAGW